VLLARLAVGVNVATSPEYATVPGTATPPTERVKEVAVIVAGVIGSLKVALNTWPTGTFMAPFAGIVETTIGVELIVVKDHT
jgi:hypothetical protein